MSAATTKKPRTAMYEKCVRTVERFNKQLQRAGVRSEHRAVVIDAGDDAAGAARVVESFTAAQQAQEFIDDINRAHARHQSAHGCANDGLMATFCNGDSCYEITWCACHKQPLAVLPLKNRLCAEGRQVMDLFEETFGGAANATT